jgi:pilus assembly protein CpaE
MSKNLSVLLIEDSTDYAELVETWLSSTFEGVTFELAWTETLAGGLRRLESGGVDLALLDLGLPDSTGPEGFHQVRALAPRLPVIVLSAADSESVALQLIRQGADDYLVKTKCDRDTLVKAIRYAHLRRGAQGEQSIARDNSNLATVIGVMGAKGGVGTSTIALTVAAELQKQTNERTLIADMDANAGLLPLLGGFEPRYTLRDAIENLSRLDRTCWDKIVSQTGSVDALPSPALIGLEEVDNSAVTEVLDAARGFYRWIVLDLARPTTLSMRLAGLCQTVLLVTSPEITGLYEAKRVIVALNRAEIQQETIRVIINQAQGNSALSGSDLKSVFGLPVYADLPSNPKDLNEATLQRKLPSESSAFRKEMTNLARRLAGLSEIRLKRSLMPLLGLGSKARTGTADRNRV